MSSALPILFIVVFRLAGCGLGFVQCRATSPDAAIDRVRRQFARKGSVDILDVHAQL